MKKGFVNILEMIFVVIALFIAFGILFPGFTYTTKWDQALLLLKSRDIILTVDRIGKLYSYSFNATQLSEFLNEVIPTGKTSLIGWSEIEGTVKHRVVVACNCTQEQKELLYNWTYGLKINGRPVDIVVVGTNLDVVNPFSDVLLIWDYKDMTSFYNSLLKYSSNENGIVEMMDFNYQSQGNKVDNDVVQTSIFGLKWVDVDKGPSDYMYFPRKPINSFDIIYGSYKYFYHVPIPLSAPSTETVSGCGYQPSSVGDLTLNQTDYKFWICDANSVWFDRDADGVKDVLVSVDENMTIGGHNFTLNYVNDNEDIGVSFKPDYKFADFLTYTAPPGEPDPPGRALGVYRVFHIEPIDDNSDRILMYATFQLPSRQYPAVILNGTNISRVAWIADFTENGVGDDERTLLISLLLWASNKKSIPVFQQPIKFGYSSSYFNVVNKDMFEVYRFDLGLAHPY